MKIPSFLKSEEYDDNDYIDDQDPEIKRIPKEEPKMQSATKPGVSIKTISPSDIATQERIKKINADKLAGIANGLSEEDASIICDILMKKYPSVMFQSVITNYFDNVDKLTKLKHILNSWCSGNSWCGGGPNEKSNN